MRAWLATYDLNLPLLDVIDDPEANAIAARLAALALPEGPDGGFYDAEALADAVTARWCEQAHGIRKDGSEASSVLADLLDRTGGYTRCLYDSVRQLPAEQAARHLHAHAKRMMDRADMGRIACGAVRAAV